MRRTPEPPEPRGRTCAREAVLYFVLPLLAGLGLGTARAATAHPPGSGPGVALGWIVAGVSAAAGFAIYRSARRGGKPLFWGALMQIMRLGALVLILVFAAQIRPPWFEAFVETLLLSYLCCMVAEVLYMHLEWR